MTDLKKLSFTAAEYHRRVARVQLEIGQRELDVVIVSASANLCYLTGFQTIGSYGYGMYAALVLPAGDPILFGSDFELHNGRITAWLNDWVIYPVMADPVEWLARLIADHGLADKRIGVEQIHHALTVREFKRLRELLPNARFLDASDVVESAMRIKSPAEIEVLRHAARLSNDGMRAAVKHAIEGVYDNDVAAAVYQAVVAAGGEYFSIQPIVTSGARSGIPHSTFRRTRLSHRDTVFIEVVASYERYSAPLMRTVSLGKPTLEVQRAFEACRASVSTLIEHLRPGSPAKEVARLAGDALRCIEPDLVWHGYYGYSVGLSFPPMCSDCPNVEITEASTMELQVGMVFHVSTSLRKIGHYGTAMSETLLVTERGCEVLTDFPRELIIR